MLINKAEILLKGFKKSWNYAFHLKVCNSPRFQLLSARKCDENDDEMPFPVPFCVLETPSLCLPPTHILLTSSPFRRILAETHVLSFIPSSPLYSVPAEAPDPNELTGKCQISSPFIPVWCDISVGLGRLCRLAYTATTAADHRKCTYLF